MFALSLFLKYTTDGNVLHVSTRVSLSLSVSLSALCYKNTRAKTETFFTFQRESLSLSVCFSLRSAVSSRSVRLCWCWW